MKSKIKVLGLILFSLILIAGIQSQTRRECIRVVDGDTIILDGNEKVRLEYDQNKIDKYGRTLAYVYLEYGTFLNAEIIKQGYGFAYTIFPFKYLEEFRQYKKEARENERGLWAPRKENIQEVNEDTVIYITRSGKKYHTADCRYLSKSKIPITLKEVIQIFPVSWISCRE